MTTGYGIIVSKEGYDATTASVENISFSSDYPFFKVHSDTTGSTTVPSGSTTGAVDFNHSLGYVPAFIAYVQFSWYDAYERPIPFGRSPQPVVVTAFANSSKVRCRVNMTTREEDSPFTFRVIIFKDKIA